MDYSEHWPTLGADGVAYVPGVSIGEGDIAVSIGSRAATVREQIDCSSDRPYRGLIQKIDGQGNVLETIRMIPLLQASRWAGLVPSTLNQCDPLHINFVDVIGNDVGSDFSAGDLVVSLRNLSRFAIIDPKTHRIKRMVAGNFVRQHSVHHLSGSKFVMFDNMGGDPEKAVSRILEIDVSTGEERQIFPNAMTPEKYANTPSYVYGYLSLSPDRKRLFASFTLSGLAFEIDIASGRLISVYDNIHDVSAKSDVPKGWHGHAVRFNTLQVSYDRDD